VGKNVSEHYLYSTWVQIKLRVDNPNYHHYHSYGGRGIKVCDRWRGSSGFLNFIEDMGERPSPEHTVDRIDNDGNYEPENCRWAHKFDQQANKRGNASIIGVYPTKSGRWRTSIKVDKVSHYIGTYDTPDEAIAARKAKEKEFGINYSPEIPSTTLKQNI
jgi:hypothetical protein